MGLMHVNYIHDILIHVDYIHDILIHVDYIHDILIHVNILHTHMQVRLFIYVKCDCLHTYVMLSIPCSTVDCNCTML